MRYYEVCVLALPKNRTQCPWTRLETRLLDLESIKPLRLLVCCSTDSTLKKYHFTFSLLCSCGWLRDLKAKMACNALTSEEKSVISCSTNEESTTGELYICPYSVESLVRESCDQFIFSLNTGTCRSKNFSVYNHESRHKVVDQ